MYIIYNVLAIKYLVSKNYSRYFLSYFTLNKLIYDT